MLKICELWSAILWYELNPRVRCAFGNVSGSSLGPITMIKSSKFLKKKNHVVIHKIRTFKFPPCQKDKKVSCLGQVIHLQDTYCKMEM